MRTNPRAFLAPPGFKTGVLRGGYDQFRMQFFLNSRWLHEDERTVDDENMVDLSERVKELNL